MSTLADAIIFKVKIAEQVERFDDVLDLMVSGGLTSANMTVEARDLLSKAAQKSVEARREALRALAVSTVTSKEPDKIKSAALLKEYSDRIYGELKHIALDKVVKTVGVWKDASNTSDVEKDLFFAKMVGDCYHYLIEFEPVPAERARYIEEAERAYGLAITKAAGLAVTNPRRLGLMLNYSVYLQGVKKTEEASRVAKECFDKAFVELESIDDDDYKEATLIMSLLRGNVTLWASDHQDELDD